MKFITRLLACSLLLSTQAVMAETPNPLFPLISAAIGIPTIIPGIYFVATDRPYEVPTCNEGTPSCCQVSFNETAKALSPDNCVPSSNQAGKCTPTQVLYCWNDGNFDVSDSKTITPGNYIGGIVLTSVGAVGCFLAFTTSMMLCWG